MQPFTSKELYIMNGGQKLYIYKDGFDDIYHATAEEEAQWAQEVVEIALYKIATEENSVTLQHAIANLQYHKYKELKSLLLRSIGNTSPKRQIAFAAELWKIFQYEKSFDLIIAVLKQYKATYAEEVFIGLYDFKFNDAARQFLVSCIEGDDANLFAKAQRTLTMWAWTGLPGLREGKLLETLQFENKNLLLLKITINRLKQILNINN